MEIVELVEPSTKKLTGTDHKHAVLRRKTRGRESSSKTNPRMGWGENFRTRYVDHLVSELAHICMINGKVNFS